MLTLILLFSFLSGAQAQEPDSALKQQFCSRTPETIRKEAGRRENRLHFANAGGFLGLTGVCWWHSRFERAADYLALFNPTAPKPTEAEAKKLIQHLTRRNQVVVIPGFHNLREFSAEFEPAIQKGLNHWMMRDTLVNQAWVHGVKGHWKLSPDRLQTQMDSLYAQVTQSGDVTFVVLQIKGIVAHAWNIISMEPIENGYLITATDSNFVDGDEVVQIRYQRGDTTFKSISLFRGEYQVFSTEVYQPFVPYLAWDERETNRIHSARDRFCDNVQP